MTTRRSAVKSISEEEPELLVSRVQMDQEIEQCIESGQKLLDRQVQDLLEVEHLEDDFRTWNEYNEKLLTSRFTNSKVAAKYRPVGFRFSGKSSLTQELQWVHDDINQQLRKLRSIRGQLELFPEKTGVSREVVDAKSSFRTGCTRIVVVHGHDSGVKLEVADFLNKVTGVPAIIFHQEPDRGRTIIEKLEQISLEVKFAVVLLTADDVGRGRPDQEERLRARQNVVFEFGYFMSLLGRKNVVALYEEGVELPSDLNGILYKPLVGNWKIELGKELREAEFDVDFARL